jgi:hypothetical protein
MGMENLAWRIRNVQFDGNRPSALRPDWHRGGRQNENNDVCGFQTIKITD